MVLAMSDTVKNKPRCTFCWCVVLLFFLGLHPTGWMANPVAAQTDWRVGVPVNLEFGLNFAKVDADPGSNWSQREGTAYCIASGVGLRYRERLNINLMGGVLLDNYNFLSNYATYQISHFMPQARINLNYLFPLKSDRTKAIVIGSDFGRSFIVDDFRLNLRQAFFVRTDAYGPSANFIAPEIGFARTWSYGQMSFMLTYHYLFRDEHTVQVAIEETSGANLTARSKSDYLALRLRANFDVRGHKDPVQEFTPFPKSANSMSSRDTRIRREITSKRRVVHLRFWDNAEIDGDTISVSLNGRYILTEHALDHKKKRVKVVLEPGENVIVVHAHNEGRIPPNTAAFSIRTGLFSREQLVFSTNMKRNESIIVTY